MSDGDRMVQDGQRVVRRGADTLSYQRRDSTPLSQENEADGEEVRETQSKSRGHKVSGPGMGAEGRGSGDRRVQEQTAQWVLSDGQVFGANITPHTFLLSL